MGRRFSSCNGMDIKFCENLNIATFPARRTGGARRPFLGMKVLVPVKMFTLKRSTAGAFVVPLRLLSREKKYNRRYGAVLELLPQLLGVKNVSCHFHKTGPWYLLGFLFEISQEHPCTF